jgi:hypothetical protein
MYTFIFAKTHGTNRCHKSSHWQTVKSKISTSPSPVELVHHSSYDSSALPEILPTSPQIFPCPLTLTFPFFFSFFSFLSRLLTYQLKIKNLKKRMLDLIS